MVRPVSTQHPPSGPPSDAAAQAAGVSSVAQDVAAVKPLDFLLITSRIDFERSCKQFVDACGRAAVEGEIVFIEDLPGNAAGDKLAALHRKNAALHRSGRLSASTIKIALLHGGMGVPAAHPDLVRFRQDYLGDPATSPSTPAAETHTMSAANDTISFPTELMDAALRATSIIDGQARAEFRDTVIFGACGSAMFREAASKTGGSYVFGSGKKSVYVRDFDAGLSALVDAQARRARENLPPLSGRDCWMLMSNVSGEHVSYVAGDSMEIHKILQSGFSEPVLSARTAAGDGNDRRVQGIRTLYAKISHGSANSVSRVIARWGPDLLSADHAQVVGPITLWTEVLASERERAQKMRLLLSHMPDQLPPMPTLLTCLNAAIDDSSLDLLVELFERMKRSSPLPMSLETSIAWLKSRPQQAKALAKFCRGSRQMTDVVGSHLARAVAEAVRTGYPAHMSLPEPFAGMVKRAQQQTHQSSPQ
ncbi:MAG: hypothetical protein NBV65_02190 [Burkholderiaceae bacterium]|nr:hypothetical protein [Burkholderiaceae bacterium]